MLSKLPEKTNWKEWGLPEWNDAILSAVFFDPRVIGEVIFRIEASDRLLSQVTLDSTCSPEDAKQSFIHSFGRSEKTLKSRFIKANLAVEKYDTTSFPDIFAALYLSLLAASADNTTAGEGNFRMRFSEMTKCPASANWSFEYLPSMWRYLAGWTQARSAAVGDCAVLQLPDPHSETLIGYSKRLAFPTYKDEQLLRSILSEDLTESPSMEDVIKSVKRRQSLFSTSFLQELDDLYNRVIDGDFLGAEQTPLWSVVQSIAIQETREHQVARGKIEFSLDLSDSFDTTLWIFLDSVAADTGIFAYREVQGGAYKNYPYFATEETGVPMSLKHTSRFLLDDAIWSRTRLGRSLKVGFLALFPDVGGRFSSSGCYFDGSDICVLVDSSFSNSLESSLSSAGISFDRLRAGSELDQWRVLLLPRVLAAQFSSFVNKILPTSIRGFYRTGINSQRLSLSGGAWLGQSLLLNPANDLV